MSRVIEPERIAEGDLTEEEVLYLVTRDQLDINQAPAEVQEAIRARLDQSGQLPPHAYANTGAVNTAGETIEQLEARLARMKAEQGFTGEVDSSPGEAAESMQREVRRQRRPITADDEEPDEDDEPEEDDDGELEDYSTERGWSNDTRRAELSRRGLSVDGNMEKLIDRLMADDESKE